MLWKWVSQHRLFHLESQKCLGLDITKATDNLRMFSCDSKAMLWWKCEHHSLYTAAQYSLALKDGYATASTNSSDVWKKGGSKENLCDQPYHGELPETNTDPFAVMFASFECHTHTTLSWKPDCVQSDGVATTTEVSQNLIPFIRYGAGEQLASPGSRSLWASNVRL